jgi:hypothetical protein
MVQRSRRRTSPAQLVIWNDPDCHHVFVLEKLRAPFGMVISLNERDVGSNPTWSTTRAGSLVVER